MTIKSDFRKAEELVIDASEKAIRGMALKLFGAIVDDTPVDSGRLRSNWQASLNQPKSTTLDDDKSAFVVKQEIDDDTSKYDVRDDMYLTNNLDYASFIEDGTAKISPHGMVKRAVANFKSALKKQARKHRIQ